MMDHPLPKISDTIIKKVSLHRSTALEGVVKVDPTKLATDYLDLDRARELFHRIQPFLPNKGGRILEMGSGFGSFVGYTSKWEHRIAFGIEPNPDSVTICRDVLEELRLPSDRILRAFGENTPFSSNSFDAVCSFTVLEHVHDPGKVLSEAIRVLKPGGILYFTFPNYGSWWEGHYGILWLPHIPKPLAKGYVRLLGRNPRFLDHLQLIDNRRLSALLKPLVNDVDIMETGFRIWKTRLEKIGVDDWAQMSRLKGWVKIIHRLRLVKMIVWLGRIFHWETPFVLILRKKG